MKESCILFFFSLILCSCGASVDQPIDRYALVNRHNVVIHSIDSLSPLTVGNGEFAFTTGITGLQSFPECYSGGIPLGTYSNWGWHSFPNTGGYHHEQVVRYFNHDDRSVGYYHDFSAERTTERARASKWLRENPQRINLGLLGMQLSDENGEVLDIEAIQNPRQELNLWKGEIYSSFEVNRIPVEVITFCDPERDMVLVKIRSALLRSGQLRIELRFPEADPGWKNTIHRGNDSIHTSRIISSDQNSALIEHIQDSTRYTVFMTFNKGTVTESGVHHFVLFPAEEEDCLFLGCGFQPGTERKKPAWDPECVRARTHAWWKAFWESGGAVDFSRCTDPRAVELERRVVLSQYITMVQCSGKIPPQETGLTYNSWYGKFHLEMHWWHAVHFALWQKEHILAKQMGYYSSIADQACELATFQGYSGVRWPKMTDLGGLTSPSTIGNYLIWQQPHYIYFAELLYRFGEDTAAALREYADLVFKTADFMATFPVMDSLYNRYVLAPPLVPAQESLEVQSTLNPAFELVYWKWALKTAILWKERLKEPVPMEWKDVLNHLSTLPVQDSLYLFAENATDSYTNPRYLTDHPMVLGVLGMLPSTGLVDPVILSNTYDRVISMWNWPTTWGWDYPMIAMCAGALGRPEDAVDILMMDTGKNTYLPNGHNYQDERLTVYLPGNGGLLTAVARLCTKDQFPRNGKWNVRWENLNNL